MLLTMTGIGIGLRVTMESQSRLRVYPVDGEGALVAGELSAVLIDRGERLEIEDVLVVTTLHDETAILTRNSVHFDQITGIDVESS